MSDAPINVKSKDIDLTRISISHILEMRKHFNTFGDDPKDVISDDTFARYLVARDDNLQEAIAQLERARHWRCKNLCQIDKDKFKSEFDMGVYYQRGFDKTGHPLVILRTKCQNKEERNMKNAAMAAIWYMDYILANVMPEDKSKVSLLIDRSDIRSPDYEFLKIFKEIFKDLFAERINLIVVHPTGLVFAAIWNIVKWFMDPLTREKVNPCLMQRGILEHVDAEHIPSNIGGESNYEFNPEDYLNMSREIYPNHPDRRKNAVLTTGEGAEDPFFSMEILNSTNIHNNCSL